MKLAVLVLLSCIILANSASLSVTSEGSSSSEEFLAQAAAQLQRLGQLSQRTQRLQQPLKLYALPEGQEEFQAEAERLKRSDVYPASMQSLYDLESDLIMQERIKRSGGGLLTAIGSRILGKVAGLSASSSASSSSSGKGHTESVEYGPPVHSYDDKQFDVWAFKKAILNTLFQALKAIGGGVIALKGQLIKGGGHIVATKGRIISAKGEAITSLGRHLASSAIISPPKSNGGHSGYSYVQPHHVPSTGHDSGYEGPPPGAHSGYGATGPSDSYHGSPYGAPSDDGAQAGLLILKPIKPVQSHDDGHGDDHHEEVGVSDHHQSSYEAHSPDHGHGEYQPHDVDPRQPQLSSIVESFGGLNKGSGLGGLLASLAGASGSQGQTVVEHDIGHDDYYPEHKDEQKHEPAPTYGVPAHESHQQDLKTVVHSYGVPGKELLSQPPNLHSSIPLPSTQGAPSQTYLPNQQLLQMYLPPSQNLQTHPNVHNFPNGQLSPFQISQSHSIGFNSNPYANFYGATQSEPLKLPILPAISNFYGDNNIQNLDGSHGSPALYGSYKRRSVVSSGDVDVQSSLANSNFLLSRVNALRG